MCRKKDDEPPERKGEVEWGFPASEGSLAASPDEQQAGESRPQRRRGVKDWSGELIRYDCGQAQGQREQ